MYNVMWHVVLFLLQVRRNFDYRVDRRTKRVWSGLALWTKVSHRGRRRTL